MADTAAFGFRLLRGDRILTQQRLFSGQTNQECSVLLSVFSLRFTAYLRDLCVKTAVNAENAENAENRRETLLK